MNFFYYLSRPLVIPGRFTIFMFVQLQCLFYCFKDVLFYSTHITHPLFPHIRKREGFIKIRKREGNNFIKTHIETITILSL